MRGHVKAIAVAIRLGIGVALGMTSVRSGAPLGLTLIVVFRLVRRTAPAREGKEDHMTYRRGPLDDAFLLGLVAVSPLIPSCPRLSGPSQSLYASGPLQTRATRAITRRIRLFGGRRGHETMPRAASLLTICQRALRSAWYARRGVVRAADWDKARNS
jgi:hypothetical protein